MTLPYGFTVRVRDDALLLRDWWAITLAALPG